MSKGIVCGICGTYPDEVSALLEEMKVLRDAIAKAPEDTFGVVYDTDLSQGYFIRDALVDAANKVIGI